MFVLHGRLSMAGRHRASAELYVRSASGEMVLVFHAQRERGKLSEGPVWKMSYAHPLSMFQAFCVLLTLQIDEELPSSLAAATTAISTAASVLSQWRSAKEPPASSCSASSVPNSMPSTQPPSPSLSTPSEEALQQQPSAPPLGPAARSPHVVSFDLPEEASPARRSPGPPSSPGPSTPPRAAEQPETHNEQIASGTPTQPSSTEKAPPSPTEPHPTETVMRSPSTPLSSPPPPPDSEVASPSREPMATPSPPPSRQAARSPALPPGPPPDAAWPFEGGVEAWTMEPKLVPTSAPQRSQRACDPESPDGAFKNQLLRL